MKAILDGLKALGPTRLAAMGAVALGLLALLAVMVMRAGSSDQMALLYGDLDPRDASQMVDQLNKSHVPYRLGANGNEILVPADQVATARVALAKEGLPTGGSIGYELFDRGDTYLFSSFQQQIAETRALEGELDRTIRAIRGVRQARVNLVLPRRSAFTRDQREARASVMLTMIGGRRLDKEGIRALLNLVAAAVPGLRADHIAVVDSRGDLLASSGQPVTDVSRADSDEDVRQAVELRLDRAVETMLEKTLGAGHVRAEASVRMNFDKVKETKEAYDPDSKVERSTQTVESSSTTTEPNGTVTAQNNLPNANAGNQNNGSKESRREETDNYEISKTVRSLLHDQPQIERISLAVMVDGIVTTAPDGKTAWRALPKTELDRITNLVKSAIGFDPKRGDQVTVTSMRFVDDTPPPPEPPGILGVHLEKSDLMRLAQTALFGVIGLLALLLVLRPMVTRLTALAPRGLIPDGMAAGGLALADGGAAGAARGGSGMMALPAPAGDGEAASREDEAMVSIAQIEGQMRASSIRRLADIVSRHPDETLSIMRGWMAQENG
jgi:flagellar M-ring protein FliF